MRLPPRIHILWLFTCLILLNEHTDARNNVPDRVCPIGFKLAYTKSNSRPICYKLKGPEKFEDKFENCVGNLFNLNLYFSLGLPTKKVLWAEFKSLHDGGQFIDLSYTNRTTATKQWPWFQFRKDKRLCLVIDPVSNVTSTGCDEKHFRYCFVEPYPSDFSLITTNGCEHYPASWRMHSPSEVCIREIHKVRATWTQAVTLCAAANSTLLSRGWMYSNYVWIGTPYGKHPLGYDVDIDLILKETTKDSEYPEDPAPSFLNSSRNFAMENMSVTPVNESDIFFSVLCEKSIQLRNINMSLTVDRDNNIILAVNDSIDTVYIICLESFANPIPILYIRENAFILFPQSNGYYWCFHFDYKNYIVSESNRLLYVNPKSAENLYAITIRWNKRHFPSDPDDLLEETKDKLQKIIYKKTRKYGTDVNIAQPELEMSMTRVYFDEGKAVFHVNLIASYVPLIKEKMDDFQVLKIKRAYFCDEHGPNNTTKLGESVQSGCILYKCVGDFDEGVNWVQTVVDGCTTPPVTELDDLYDGTPSQKRSILPQFNGDLNDTMPSLPENLNPNNTNTLMPKPPPNNITTLPITQPEVTATEPYVTIDNSSGVDVVTTPSEVVTATSSPGVNNFTTPSEVVTATSSPGVNTVTTPPEDSSSEEVTTPNAITTTTMHPSEQFEQVLNDLENLLSNDTVPLENAANALDQVNNILDFEGEELEAPERLLHLLDELGSRVELNDQPTAKTVRGNIAMLTADVGPENPIRGMRVAARATDTFENDTFSFISEEVNSSSLQTNDTEAVVYLPESILRTPRRVSFVTFRNEAAFRSNLSVNSRIFSVNVQNVTHFEHGEVVDIHLSPIEPEPGRNLSRTCAYWQFTEDGGRWDDAGCRLVVGAEGLLDTCRCNHLTHFAEVLVPRTVFSEKNEMTLEILSLIGCFLSMFGIVAIGLTAVLFRSWRRDYSNKIWLQLSVAILILILCFIVAVLVDFRNHLACMLVGIALHYSVLASFCWMLVAAVLSYRRLVLVFTRDVSHKLLRAAAFAWGLPLGIVGVLLAANPRAYVGPFDELTPSAGFCYPTGLAMWLSVNAPICAILLVNWTLFGLILRSVFASRRIQRHGATNEALRCASVSCLLVFLFGLPWIFGLFAFNVVAAYLFTITGAYQGFVLFLFFVVGNKKTRDLWLNKLKIKQTRKVPVTSSTYTSRGGAEGPSIEAKVSKPRSLTSPDDSRFS